MQGDPIVNLIDKSVAVENLIVMRPKVHFRFPRFIFHSKCFKAIQQNRRNIFKKFVLYYRAINFYTIESDSQLQLVVI